MEAGHTIGDGIHHGKIYLEYLPCVNFAMTHNQVNSYNFCNITNNDDFVWEQVKLSISGEWIKASEVIIDTLCAGETMQIKSLEISPNVNQLIELTEGIHTQILLILMVDDSQVFQQEYPLYLMAYDQWTGYGILPELLAAFVTPNHPILSRVSVNASKFLASWTGDANLDAYQSQDPNRVRKQVAAVYEALRSEALIYCIPPASFEMYGQRVRLVDKVLTEKLGTCLDLTLLFASCLEAIGIRPLLIILQGHIFVGAWLTEDMYAQMVCDDAAYLLKGCADGINDIVLIESTALSSLQDVAFEEAVHLAERQLKEESKFELFIDVARCRFSNIRPLPQRLNKDGVWQIENEGIEHNNTTQTVEQFNRFDITVDDGVDKNISRQTIWERKLLDFSLRNNLINIRQGKRVIPFISFEIDALEDRLQAGENYQILYSPTKNKIEAGESGIYDSSLYRDELKELVVNDLLSKKLRSYLTETELQHALKFIYRTARTSLEENGANSLFLVLGLLKWYENKRSIKPRFAPILLLPVDIIRRGGTAGYVIRTRDEEIILNISLIELLKQQYGVNLSGLIPLPKDDSGVDVKRIFATIRTFVRDMKGWDVIEESMLGLFSFNKFVMWNDIHNNANKLKENPVVASLINNRIEWTDTVPTIDARVMDKEEEPAHYAIPVDVDSSQIEAVIEAGKGKSFILHGPPGTGKSQTITNMIANILYQGKRVLFVAEKMAALSVVQDRLSKIGLDAFCLEMHSNKASKSHFLEQLKKAIEVSRIQSPTTYMSLSQELFSRRKVLIHYMEALHQPHRSGYSLYECITNYLSVAGDELQVEQQMITTLTKEQLMQIHEKLIEIDTVLQITGHPQDHPLRGLMQKTSSHTSAHALQIALTRYQQLFFQLMKSREFFSEKLSLPIPDTFIGIAWMMTMVTLLPKLTVLNKRIMNIVGNEALLAEYIEVIVTGKKRDEMRAELSRNFSLDVLNEDAHALQQTWKAIETKWFIPKYFAKRSYIKLLRRYNANLQECHIADFLEKLNVYQRLQQQIDAQSQDLVDIFGLLGRQGKENWDEMRTSLEQASTLYKVLLDYALMNNDSLVSVLPCFINTIGSDWTLFIQSCTPFLNQLMATFKEFEEVQKELLTLCEMDTPQENIGRTIPPLLERWLAHLDKLKDWNQWCIRKTEIESLQFDVAISYIENKHKTGTEAAQALFKGINHQMTMMIIDSDESLGLFNGLLFEQAISKYKQLTHDFQEVTKKELYCRLASHIPSMTMEATANSEVGILKRNISNGGRGTSIRRIIDQIPTLLPKLCPCMLMSPISVAQYIDLATEKFDVVIFDEASQMPTSEAVGAIARGKSLVVVGDPKQMPPTSFFSSSQVDEEEAEFDDMESILDDCLALSMPSRYLTWHYRSKHESLIAFSNSQYYEGKLYTFPSVDDRCSKVRMVRVNGFYDKGHTRSNRAEAEAIVYDIIKRLQSSEYSSKSIGVVSFSQVQQNLIEDLLLEKLAKYPELEQKALESDEPIFIKNLENVQGDERDVILFSIGYGPDCNGRVSMNFGPLNNQGGERRLNVAVSRARYEMVIYSTLRSEQIDLKRTKAKGVEGLKKFLEFAEHGTFATTVTHATQLPQQNMITLIAEEIKQHGYKVDTFIGRSEFKVDIAIADPRHPEGYLLGILCDGKNYYETKTTRDREIVQPSVLTMLHWNIMRIWSIDWFENSHKVIERIMDKLEELQKDNPDKDGLDLPLSDHRHHTFDITEEPILEQINEREKEYIFANLPNVHYTSDIDTVMASPAQVKHQLEELISIEQPITNTLLYQRIADIWGISRVTSRLQAMINSLLVGVYKDPLSDNSISIYWEVAEKSINYKEYRLNSRRDIRDIPIIEVMNAALYVLEQQISLPAEDLKRLTSQVLGFSRKGANLDAATSRAVQLLLDQAVIKEKDGLIWQIS